MNQQTAINAAESSLEHLVGNLWYSLEMVPVVAAALPVEDATLAVGGMAALAYEEMAKLIRTPGGLSAGNLERNLRLRGFDFDWLAALQGRILVDTPEALMLYARQVVNWAQVLRVRKALADAQTAAAQPDADAMTVSGNLLKVLASQGDSQQPNVATAEQLVEGFLAQLDGILSGNQGFGAPTGFGALDKMGMRLRDGDLIVLGGRPSQGKTSLARQIAIHRARQILASDEPGQVVFFTSDDTPEKVMFAMACMVAGVNGQKAMAGRLDRTEVTLLKEAADYIRQLPIVFDGTRSPTVEYMFYQVAMHNAKVPVKLIVQDYLELIDVPNVRGDQESIRVKKAADGCKGIALTFKAPFLLLSQLRKEVDSRADKWPTPSDVKYSGEEQADIMVLIMRPEHYLAQGVEVADIDDDEREGVCLLNIAKFKGGAIGKTRLPFKKEYMRFGNVVPSAA